MKQGKDVNYYKDKLANFYRKEKRMPTYSEMAYLFGFQSKNAVSKVVCKMIDFGIIGKDHLGRIMPRGSFNELPILGSVKAGLPSYAEEVTDTINLSDLLVKKSGETYILTVDGPSMIDAHIKDGDLILVERASIAKDGQIVIAEVDGEYTLKYFRTKNGQVWLEPANQDFKPIYPTNSLNVCAILRAVIRQY